MLKVGRKMDVEFKNQNFEKSLFSKQPINTNAKWVEQSFHKYYEQSFNVIITLLGKKFEYNHFLRRNNVIINL